jgi:hypothetical protein
MKKMRARYSKSNVYMQPIELAPISEFHASVAATSSFAIRSLLQKRYYDEAKQKMESPVEFSSAIEPSPIFDENTVEGSIFKHSTTASPSSITSSFYSPPAPATRYTYMPVIMSSLKNGTKAPSMSENRAFREKLSLWRHQYGPKSPDYSMSHDEENASPQLSGPVPAADGIVPNTNIPPHRPLSMQAMQSGANTSFWRQRWEGHSASHTTASALITASLEASAHRNLRPSRHPLEDISYNDASSMSKLTHMFESKLSASGCT